MPNAAAGHSRLLGHVGEGAVAVVAVERVAQGRPRREEVGPAAVHEVDVHPAVVVVVEEGAAGPIVSGRYFVADFPAVCVQRMPLAEAATCEKGWRGLPLFAWPAAARESLPDAAVPASICRKSLRPISVDIVFREKDAATGRGLFPPRSSRADPPRGRPMVRLPARPGDCRRSRSGRCRPGRSAVEGRSAKGSWSRRAPRRSGLRPPARRVTRAPMAARLLLVPISLNATQWFPFARRLSSRVGGSPTFRIRTSTVPSLSTSPKAAPRRDARGRRARPAPAAWSENVPSWLFMCSRSGCR